MSQSKPKLYDFKDHPEHKAQLEAWRDKWIANAFSTEPADQPRMLEAMRGLYEAANLEAPTRNVFVRSPMTAAIAGSVAAGVWWVRDNPDRHAALFGGPVGEAALLAAVRAACAVAVDVGMAELTGRPRQVQMPAATRAATEDATRAATEAATRAATGDATRDPLTRFLLACTQRWSYLHNGGSDWSGWAAYLSFFDHVAELELPVYDKWRHYENATKYGASRMMHQEFWIVSDRQIINERDANGLLHCEDGPARAWADGWELCYWHGVRVPPDFFTWDITRALSEKNSEIQRCAFERMARRRSVPEPTRHVGSGTSRGSGPVLPIRTEGALEFDPHALVGQYSGVMSGGTLLVNEYADGTLTAQFRATNWEQWSHPETKLLPLPVAEVHS